MLCNTIKIYIFIYLFIFLANDIVVEKHPEKLRNQPSNVEKYIQLWWVRVWFFFFWTDHFSISLAMKLMTAPVQAGRTSAAVSRVVRCEAFVLLLFRCSRYISPRAALAHEVATLALATSSVRFQWSPWRRRTNLCPLGLAPFLVCLYSRWIVKDQTVHFSNMFSS